MIPKQVDGMVRSTHKAEGNTGVRAAIYFVKPNILGWPLAALWAGIFAVMLALLGVAESAARGMIEIFSEEVNRLMGEATRENRQESIFSKAGAWLLQRLGVADRIVKKAALFREEQRKHEEDRSSEAEERARTEERAKNSEHYIKKVKQIQHDIRSPLGSLQAIYERLNAEDAGTTKALATAIRRIQGLMANLGQMGLGREEPKLVIAEVLAEEVVLLLGSKFSEIKGASLSMKYSRESLCPIKVAEKEFQGALENLLENALDAISTGGKVEISVSREGGRCRISVQDDGCGISPENIPRLFTNGGSFGKVNGVGLGLFHTKENVEAWGGAISHEALPKGTRFTIDIPLMQTGVVFSGLPLGHPLKVIDDDAVVPLMLKRAGFDIAEAVSTYEQGKVLMAAGTSEGFSILVDYRLDNDLLGTDLIAGQPGRKQVFLCTNDFDNLAVIRLARELGVKIIPKPLCFTGAEKATSKVVSPA